MTRTFIRFLLFTILMLAPSIGITQKIVLSCKETAQTLYCVYKDGKGKWDECERSTTELDSQERTSLLIDLQKKLVSINEFADLPLSEEGNIFYFYSPDRPGNFFVEVHNSLDRVTGTLERDFRWDVSNSNNRFMYPDVDSRGIGTEYTIFYKCEKVEPLF